MHYKKKHKRPFQWLRTWSVWIWYKNVHHEGFASSLRHALVYHSFKWWNPFSLEKNYRSYISSEALDRLDSHTLVLSWDTFVYHNPIPSFCISGQVGSAGSTELSRSSWQSDWKAHAMEAESTRHPDESPNLLRAWSCWNCTATQNLERDKIIN